MPWLSMVKKSSTWEGNRFALFIPLLQEISFSCTILLNNTTKTAQGLHSSDKRVNHEFVVELNVIVSQEGLDNGRDIQKLVGKLDTFF